MKTGKRLLMAIAFGSLAISSPALSFIGHDLKDPVIAYDEGVRHGACYTLGRIDGLIGNIAGTLLRTMGIIPNSDETEAYIKGYEAGKKEADELSESVYNAPTNKF